MRWLKRWKTQALLLLAVIGPGFITANVDNDAGGIFTYSFAGAQFGYIPLFTIIPMTLALIVIQEMSGIIGATIAPWMQFYLQASVVEKGISERDYKTTRIDILVASIFAVLVAAFIIIACAATLNKFGHKVIADAADAAPALGPLAGRWASILFGAGLFNASLFAASILPLSTAYTVCEGLGFESGLDKKFSEAPVFYWLYTALVGAGAAIILLPRFPLLKMLVLSQVLNGVLLPPVLIYMLLLINKRSLMGKYVNSRTFNAIAWATTAIVIALSVFYAFSG